MGDVRKPRFPYRSPLLNRIYNEAKAEGKAEGKAEARARTILIVLPSRGVTLSTEMHERVSTCKDIDQLDIWFDRALTANSADDVFKD